MPCFFPLSAFYSKDVSPNGKRPLVFRVSEAYSPTPVRIGCGQCIGCLQKRADQWATRIVHEMRLHSEHAFVTLTYSPANLPAGASLVKSDLQKFMKRLRLNRPLGLRFFACGEYGETTIRPHYHLLLLNTRFPDQIYYKQSAGGYPLYISPELGRLWPFGDHYIGEVSPLAARYVASYVVKGTLRGDWGGREPPFQVMSRRPGLGLGWFHKYGVESYYRDNCIIDAREVPLPRYYDTKEEVVDKCRLAKLKVERRRKNLTPEARANNTHKRRIVREQLAHLNLARFKRDQT